MAEIDRRINPTNGYEVDYDEYQVVQIEVLQPDDSTVCGQYCMFFILVRAYGFSYQDVLSALISDSRVNDKFICKFINTFFSLRTVVKDKQFDFKIGQGKTRFLPVFNGLFKGLSQGPILA